MSDKGIAKDVLDMVKKASGKQVSEQSLKKIASGITQKTIESEAELRKLIDTISKLVNVPVSKETSNEIIKAVKQIRSMEQVENMMKNMMKK